MGIPVNYLQAVHMPFLSLLCLWKCLGFLLFPPALFFIYIRLKNGEGERREKPCNFLQAHINNVKWLRYVYCMFSKQSWVGGLQQSLAFLQSRLLLL